MGTTFVSIGEHGFWMHDGILELWLRLMALHVEAPVEPEAAAARIRDQWLLASSGIFTGCVPHGLEEAVSTNDGLAVVRQAVNSLMQVVAMAPERLNKDVLNVLGLSGTFTQDVETQRLVEIGQAFIDLLGGEITTRASDTSFIPGAG